MVEYFLMDNKEIEKFLIASIQKMFRDIDCYNYSDSYINGFLLGLAQETHRFRGEQEIDMSDYLEGLRNGGICVAKRMILNKNKLKDSKN